MNETGVTTGRYMRVTNAFYLNEHDPMLLRFSVKTFRFFCLVEYGEQQ